jgi:hypothetical protein
MNEGIALLKRYGSEPARVNTIHERVTARYPSLLVIFFVSAFLLVKRKME